MLQLLSPALRTALALTALTGLATAAPVASAAPQGGKTKSSASKRAKPAADLTVRGLTIDFGDDALLVTATVANIGPRFARRSDVVVAISSDAKLDDGDEVVDEIQMNRTQPGRTRALDFEVDIPEEDELPDGTVYLLVCADGNGAVREKNESNNCQADVIADAAEQPSEGEPSGDGDGDSGEADGESEDFPVTVDQP